MVPSLKNLANQAATENRILFSFVSCQAFASAFQSRRETLPAAEESGGSGNETQIFMAFLGAELGKFSPICHWLTDSDDILQKQGMIHSLTRGWSMACTRLTTTTGQAATCDDRANLCNMTDLPLDCESMTLEEHLPLIHTRSLMYVQTLHSHRTRCSYSSDSRICKLAAQSW